MDTFDTLHTRRSIRKFLAKPVARAEIEQLLHAGMTAPSAGNAQPWFFTVITNKELLAKVPAIHPFAAMVPSSSASILVCGNTAAEKYPGFWPQDCAAATQNILLAARAKDIGSVWCGIYPLEERVQAFRHLFALPQELVPFAIVALGYADQKFAHQDRYDPAKVRWE